MGWFWSWIMSVGPKVAFYVTDRLLGFYAYQWRSTYWWNYDVIKWKPFPCYWSFVRVIHRSPVDSPHTVQWCGALMFSFICAWAKSKRLSKKSRHRWFETSSLSLWRHCNDNDQITHRRVISENGLLERCQHNTYPKKSSWIHIEQDRLPVAPFTNMVKS